MFVYVGFMFVWISAVVSTSVVLFFSVDHSQQTIVTMNEATEMDTTWHSDEADTPPEILSEGQLVISLASEGEVVVEAPSK